MGKPETSEVVEAAVEGDATAADKPKASPFLLSLPGSEPRVLEDLTDRAALAVLRGKYGKEAMFVIDPSNSAVYVVSKAPDYRKNLVPRDLLANDMKNSALRTAQA